VWRAVSLLSGTIAKLPLEILARQGVGKTLAVEHPAFNLLRHKPNKEMTAFAFRRAVMACALLLGNGYAYIFRRGDGLAEELIPMNPICTFPVRMDGKLFYVTDVNGQQRKLLPENVLHIKGLSLDGLAGYRVVAKARESFGLGHGRPPARRPVLPQQRAAERGAHASQGAEREGPREPPQIVERHVLRPGERA
jgi:HK97 family phage portal protein